MAFGPLRHLGQRKKSFAPLWTTSKAVSLTVKARKLQPLQLLHKHRCKAEPKHPERREGIFLLRASSQRPPQLKKNRSCLNTIKFSL